jgi:endonuclease/exonuclease/phosphatase family metal-dependent hydrolase
MNQWSNRKESLINFLAVEQPDFIGFQEVLGNQLEDIENGLSKYARIGVGREDGRNGGEYCPILIHKERFTLSDSGTFWLSETPSEPSKGWDAMLNRICTWAVLTDTRNGEILHVYNTHFSHVGELARLRSAELIMDSIRVKSAGVHVILTGDFNTEPGTDPFNAIIESGLSDSYESDITLGPEGSFNGFQLTGPFNRRIDFIFTQGFHSEYYVCNSMLINDQYLSDHFPIISLLEYKEVN